MGGELGFGRTYRFLIIQNLKLFLENFLELYNYVGGFFEDILTMYSVNVVEDDKMVWMLNCNGKLMFRLTYRKLASSSIFCMDINFNEKAT